MSIEWVACEIKTGAMIDALPGLHGDSLLDTIGRYESATLTLPLGTAPATWVRATKPLASTLNLIDTTDEENPVCLWGGFVNVRPRTQGASVDLSVATIPAYFDRRIVRDVTYTQVDQNAIVADLIARFVADGSNGGIPIRVQVVGGPGPLRDRSYLESDGKTVYSALTELMGVDGGPEWYVGWESGQLADGRVTWTPVIYVGSRIGTPKAADVPRPAVTIDLPGTGTTVTVTEDYSSGNGANDIVAVSTADASTGITPTSDHIVIPDPDRPTVELRFTPSTSIVNKATLNGHARAKAAAIADGTVTTEISMLSQASARLGIDWGIGDDLGIDVVAPAFPDGYEDVQRAWGWEIEPADPLKVTPTLVSPVEVDDAAS
jgi:hypothetical protein